MRLALSRNRRLDALAKRFRHWPPIGWVRFGSFRRVRPISRSFGFDRGQCVDRYYIERFLARHAADIHGHVLEVQDNTYTKTFGGDRVRVSDVLHITGNAAATIVANLIDAPHIPSNTFDCIVLTQTLQEIYDCAAVVRTVHRILKSSGVLLATVPGIQQICRDDMDQWGDYWRFTTASARRLFEPVFSSDHLRIDAHGNVLAAVAFLHGLATEDLPAGALDDHDRDYEVVITIRAVKT